MAFHEIAEVDTAYRAPKPIAVSNSAPPRESPTWKRPIFSRSLVSAPSGTTQSLSEAIAVKELGSLKGIVVDEAMYVAIIEVDGRYLRLREGEKLGLWQIAKIDVRSIVLKNKHDVRVLKLDNTAVFFQ